MVAVIGVVPVRYCSGVTSRLRQEWTKFDVSYLAHMTISRLPYGPTASFRMTSIVPSKAIPGHAKPTSHFPELVLSNFSTPLGLSIGTLLQSVFPPLPELEGRQVVSMQNQRDFVFFRRYRYVFAEREKV